MLVLAAPIVAALGMMALLLVMLHVHAGDVAYIAHTHRPVIVVPTGAPPSHLEQWLPPWADEAAGRRLCGLPLRT